MERDGHSIVEGNPKFPSEGVINTFQLRAIFSLPGGNRSTYWSRRSSRLAERKRNKQCAADVRPSLDSVKEIDTLQHRVTKNRSMHHSTGLSRLGKRRIDKKIAGESIPDLQHKKYTSSRASTSAQTADKEIMDSSLIENRSHLPTFISAADRAKQYPTIMVSDGEVMFCSTCNMAVDHLRKYTVDKHLQSQRHMKRYAKYAETQLIKCAQQTTVSSSLRKSEAANSANNGLLLELINNSSNISQNKRDPLGIVNPSHQLPDRYVEAKNSLKQKLQNENICVIIEETPDIEGRCVLDVIFSVVELKGDTKQIQYYLADAVFLADCNSASVAQAVVGILADYNISFHNVICFNTDDAAYMCEAYNTVLKKLYANSIHITCLAHFLNLIAESFSVPFVELNAFFLYFSKIFNMASSRKRRFFHRLLETHGMEAQMPPNPCSPLWNSWFATIEFHCKHFHTYTGFIELEMQLSKSPSDSLENLHRILSGDSKYYIKFQLDLLVKKCERMLQLIDTLQSPTSSAMKVYDYLEDLCINFKNNSDLTLKSLQPFFNNDEAAILNAKQKKQMTEQLKQAFENVHDKVSKYIDEGQPGILFLKQVRLFNPSRLSIVPQDKESYSAIPGISEVPDDEFHLYFQVAGPKAVRASVSGIIDTDIFWLGMADRLPVMSKVAIVYKDVVKSCDAERSNSISEIVLSARRNALAEKSICELVFLHYNQQQALFGTSD